MGGIIDLTRDVAAAARMGASTEAVDQLLGEALTALSTLVPYDLATIMELEGDDLRVRIARGELASPEVAKHKLSLAQFPSLREALAAGHARVFTEYDHSNGDGDTFDGVLDLPNGHSCMVIPLPGRDAPLGILTLDRQSCGVYSPDVVEVADVIGRLLGMAMSYGEQSAQLARLHDQLQEQNRLLVERVTDRTQAGAMIEASRSPEMTHVVRLARQVAATDTPVLISGETGTGKEVLANAIHGWSERHARPLVSINCAALPSGLIESELFGHVKGAFSGAVGKRMGRFQAANGGTLFLDEVGELPADLQAKLLRALQDGTFEPVGSDRTIRVDVRIIAATNADLDVAVSERTFREDLYYRLAVFPIHVPPLRARREDIPVIAQRFLAGLSRRTGRGPWTLGDEQCAWLQRQDWPGNVRELVNTLERATILGGADLDLPGSATPARLLEPLSDEVAALPTLEQMERAHIERALRMTSGKLYGPGGSAEILGINPNTLRSRMKKLGLGGARSFRR